MEESLLLIRYIPFHKCTECTYHCLLVCLSVKLHREPPRPSVALGVLIEVGENMKLSAHYIYFYVFGFPPPPPRPPKKKIITGENVLLSGGEAIWSLQNSAPFLTKHGFRWGKRIIFIKLDTIIQKTVLKELFGEILFPSGKPKLRTQRLNNYLIPFSSINTSFENHWTVCRELGFLSLCSHSDGREPSTHGTMTLKQSSGLLAPGSFIDCHCVELGAHFLSLFMPVFPINMNSTDV